jgi:xylan 1,4-beta-xylosidase
LTRHNYNAVVSLQDLSEYYTPTFKACAKDADVGAFMCSYNAVNGVPACANPYLMETILRDHWDWDDTDHHYGGNRSNAVATSLKAGTDLDCGHYYTDHLPEALDEGLITEGDLDKALTRLFTSLVKLGYFNSAASQPLRRLGWNDVNLPSSQQLAYQAAVEGIVLLKNDGSLPLKNSTMGGKALSLALIGPMVNATRSMQGNYAGNAPHLVTPYQAAQKRGFNITTATGVNVNSASNTEDTALSLAKNADAIIYIGGIDNSIESESLDRTNIAWPNAQLAFLRKLTAQGKPVYVIRLGGGQLDDTELLANDTVSGLIWAGYPGQEGGTALMDIVFGAKSPSGRLPLTVYPASYASEVKFTDMALRPSAGNNNLGRTYMWYAKPVLPFGHGLSYAQWNTSWDHLPESTTYSTSGFFSGSSDKSDWNALLTATLFSFRVEVDNDSDIPADYVALLFVKSDAGPKPAPLKRLAAYARVSVPAAESKTVELNIKAEQLVRADGKGNKVLYPGNYEVQLDTDARLTWKFKITGEPQTVEQWPQPDDDSDSDS